MHLLRTPLLAFRSKLTLIVFLGVCGVARAQHHELPPHATLDRSIVLEPVFEERVEQKLDEFRNGYPAYAFDCLQDVHTNDLSSYSAQINSENLFRALAAYLRHRDRAAQSIVDNILQNSAKSNRTRTQAALLSALEFFAHQPLRKADAEAALSRLQIISDDDAANADATAEVSFWRAEAFRALGQYEQADIAYAASVTSASTVRERAFAEFRLAELYERRYMLRQADSLFAVVSKTPQSPYALLASMRRASALRGMDKFESALAVIASADSAQHTVSTENPRFERDLEYESDLIADLTLTRPHTERILDHFEPASNNSSVPQLISPFFESELALLRGSVLSSLGRYDEATTVLRKGEALNDSLLKTSAAQFRNEGRFMASALRFERAWSLFQRGRYADASSAFLELAVADSSDESRLSARGTASSLRDKGMYYDPFLNDSVIYSSAATLPANALETAEIDTSYFFFNDFPGRARYYAAVSLVRAGMLSEAADVLEKLARDKTMLYSDLATYQLALIRFGQHSYEAANLLDPVASEQTARGAYASLLLGELAYRKGLYERAEAYFLNSFANIPANDTAARATAHLERGLSLLPLGAWHDAADELHTYLNQSHEHIAGRTDEALFWLGKAYLRDQQYDSALATYRTLLAEYPNSARSVDAQYGYAWSLFESNNYAEAADAFQRVVGMDSISRFSYDVLARAGDSYYTLGDFKRADILYNAAVDRPAFNELRTTRALLMLGISRYRLDSARSAMNIFNYLANRYPKSDIIDEAHFDRALAAYSINLTADAEKEIQAIYMQYRQSALAPRGLFVAAQERERRDDLKGSLTYYHQLLRDYPRARETGSALFALQNTLLQLRKPAEALAVADTFTKHNPESPLNPDLLERSGEISLRLNDAAKAKQLLQAFIAKYPDHSLRPRAEFLLARSSEVAKDTASALKQLADVISKYDSLDVASDAHLERARIFRKQNQHAQAAEDYRVAFSDLHYSSDAAPQAMIEYGEMLAEDKKVDSAIAIFRALSTRYPIEASVSARGAIRAGELLAARGETDAARTEYNRVAEAHPKDAVGGAAIVRIGESYNIDKNYKLSIPLLEDIKKTHPISNESEARRLLALAEAQIATGKNTAAALILRELVRSQGITAHQRTTAVAILAQITPEKAAPHKGKAKAAPKRRKRR
jgi:TolA-binding protein